MINRLSTFAMVLLASLVLAASATAATRYAAPTGLANLNCPIDNPCDLTTAVNDTAYGDEVILLAGTYDVTPTSANTPGISTAQAVTIRGESPFTPPLIRSSPTVSSIGFMVNYGVTLRDVRVSYLGSNATSNALHVGQNATVERVHVDAGATPSAACTAGDGTVYINTACIAHGLGATALDNSIGMNASTATVWSFNAVVRNSTFVSTGDSGLGVRIYAGNMGTDQLNQRITAVNSIFRATGAASFDVAVQTGHVANNTAELIAQNSNYSSVTSGGPGTESSTDNTTDGNQDAAPIFTNPAVGDLSQAAGSPTIDAGIDDPANGTLDLAAKPRSAGARTDIGAYEFQPPTIPTPPAPAYALSALDASPTRFRAAVKGSTLRPASTRPKTKRGQKPIGSLLALRSTDAGELRLYAFQVLKGRRSKTGKCAKPSRANARGKRCTYYKRQARVASAGITQGLNRFYFTGRWNGRKLLPGRYLLVAKHADKSASIPSPTVRETGVTKRTVTIIR